MKTLPVRRDYGLYVENGVKVRFGAGRHATSDWCFSGAL